MDRLLTAIFEKHKDRPGNTVIVLQDIQNHYEYLPQEALEAMSRFYTVPLSEIYGVATFYSQFKFNRPGRHKIKVCHGTACHINSAVAITRAIENYLDIGDGETTSDGLFSMEQVACLGCCSLAPVIMINDKVYGNLDEKKVVKILEEHRKLSSE